MEITSRCYLKEQDYNKVLNFWRQEYNKNPYYTGWKAQRFEDMEYRLNTMYIYSGSVPWHHCIYLWEENAEIVSLCIGERPGENFFYTKKGYEFLYPQMVEWTKGNMSIMENGERKHTFWIDDSQKELIDILHHQKFIKEPTEIYLMEHMMENLQQPVLPKGFKIIYGNEIKDTVLKANISHWGFNPSQEGVENIAIVEAGKNRLNAPMFDEQFEVMVQKDNGDLCSYAYFWVDNETKSAYVEPVSTREKYRKHGLGKAMLVSELFLCKQRGITKAYVEPYGGYRKTFYESAGFKAYGKMGIWNLTEKFTNIHISK